MGDFIAAIDQGTTSTRFIVFDRQGNIVALDQKEHKQFYPAPGWVEHDPMEIWNNTREVIQNSMRISGLRVEDIAALGITNQRETTVIWNKSTGFPVSNAIVWQDTRTADICNQLDQSGKKEIIENKTGLPLATYFSGPRLNGYWIIIPNGAYRQKMASCYSEISTPG